MYEKAKAISAVISPSGGEPDMTAIFLALEAMKSMDGSKSSASAIHMQSAEAYLNSPGIQSMKIALPFAAPEQRRMLGGFIKLLEFQKLFEMMNDLTRQQGKHWKHDLLVSIRPHVTKEKQKFLDDMLMMIDYSIILEDMRSK